MLNFMLGIYAMNGTFLGYSDLQGHLSQCPLQYKDMLTMKKFGSISVSKCNIMLKDLLNKLTLPGSANNFFELFLQDTNGNLIDIPVLIKNLRTQDQSGATQLPN